MKRAIQERSVLSAPYELLDRAFVPKDKDLLKRTWNIRLIPDAEHRTGGKFSYAEWAHVIGIFQTLMAMHLDRRDDNHVLDIGCGMGLLGIAAEPFLGQAGGNGGYVGIDVTPHFIEFCREHYPSETHRFLHLNIHNAEYTPDQPAGQQPWEVEDGSFDLAVALSVWTHMNEEDARFYLSEVHRVLKPGAKAIVTCFVLDEAYERSVPNRSSAKGRFDTTPTERWIFDQPMPGSGGWFTVNWPRVAEAAIGIAEPAFRDLLERSGLQLTAFYPGSWKETPGIYFQDVAVLQKA